MYGCQCPLRLYYHKFRDDLRNPEDEQQESIFAAGTNVGILAQGLFPEGVNAEPPDAFSFHLSVDKTQELIKQGVKIIYEAAFNFEGILCAIDILVCEKNKWYALEVKGSTKVKEPFVMDASLQYYVISNSGIKLEDIFIVHLNNQYVRKGDLELDKLFNKVSILKEVKANQKFITSKAFELKELLKLKKEPSIEPGDHCSDPYDCDFTNHCWRNIQDEKKVAEEYLDKKGLKEFLADFTYPLHYFDFESIMPAVPEFDESRSYQQIPFQYSMHIQKKKNAELDHVYFLGDGKNDPRVDLIKQLLIHVGPKGSIVTWNKTFEITRLKELARDFPKYQKEINSIIERVVDLMVPFRKKTINHPDFGGSYSIKKVLPVLVPELNYADLNVSDGGSASLLYAELKNHPEEIQKQHREDLLEYCGMDTLAMVKILEKLHAM